jgi:hypothetical protein
MPVRARRCYGGVMFRGPPPSSASGPVQPGLSVTDRTPPPDRPVPGRPGGCLGSADQILFSLRWYGSWPGSVRSTGGSCAQIFGSVSWRVCTKKPRVGTEPRNRAIAMVKEGTERRPRIVTCRVVISGGEEIRFTGTVADGALLRICALDSMSGRRPSRMAIHVAMVAPDGRSLGGGFYSQRSAP